MPVRVPERLTMAHRLSLAGRPLAVPGVEPPGSGVLYRLVPHGANFAEKMLYSFCSKRNCRDGGDPWATPLSDAQGHLFGTLTTGGDNAAHEGGIFEWDTTLEAMIYSFCNQQHCADGYS